MKNEIINNSQLYQVIFVQDKNSISFYEINKKEQEAML